MLRLNLPETVNLVWDQSSLQETLRGTLRLQDFRLQTL